MLATDFIKEYPYACEEAMKWVDSLEKGVTAEEAWEICPDGSWMAWAVSEIGVARDEIWVWADLARLWTADVLDKAGVDHRVRECLPITDEDSTYAAAKVVRSAYRLARSKNTPYAAVAAINATRSIKTARTAGSTLATADVSHVFNIFSVICCARAADIAFTCNAICCTETADMIRERIKNPFRRDLC